MENPNLQLNRLNPYQHEAVVAAEKRILVLAGAGSGKTKTLLQKLIYLIEEKNVSPANILAITFTKNAANEMIDRLLISADTTNSYTESINNKNLNAQLRSNLRFQTLRKYRWINKLTIKTFHSLCLEILKNYGVKEFDNKFRIITDTKTYNQDYTVHSAQESSYDVLHKALIQNCENENYSLLLKRFILDYMVDRIQYYEHISRPNYPKGKFYTSLNGTKVRSKSEQYIADWLYRHSIRFEYEPLLEIKDFKFRPDFYIPEANLYIEHVSNKSAPMKDKEEQFSMGGKHLVKTFEKQTHNTAYFNLILERIVKNRLPANYKYTSALHFEEEFTRLHKEIKDFLRQVLQLIDMIKIEGIDPEKLNQKAQKDKHERIRIFYQLATPLIKAYLAYCTNKSYLDFNDMITTTISLFRNHTDIALKYRNKFKYILVDEFQDVNKLQVELIKELITRDTQLFCVGDDWQSIYGFRGSDVDYIINFSRHFNDSHIIKLNLNYRSTENIVGASNEVIKQNKHKIDKELRASKKSSNKINIYVATDLDDALNFAVNKVSELQNNQGYSAEDVLFLYRRSKMFAPFYERFRNENIRVSAKTIHSAKGLEANAVFIIGLTEGYGGFPDIWMEDRIYQIVKESNHDLLLEEERRLFYVALTRAKEQLFLITEKGNESSFLHEIPHHYTVKTTIPLNPVVEEIFLCPWCQSQLVDNGFAFCPYCGKKI